MSVYAPTTPHPRRRSRSARTARAARWLAEVEVLGVGRLVGRIGARAMRCSETPRALPDRSRTNRAEGPLIWTPSPTSAVKPAVRSAAALSVIVRSMGGVGSSFLGLGRGGSEGVGAAWGACAGTGSGSDGGAAVGAHPSSAPPRLNSPGIESNTVVSAKGQGRAEFPSRARGAPGGALPARRAGGASGIRWTPRRSG